MDFRILRYFLAVASNLSFSRAAENLHVAQSTLSQQIRQLEEYYGVQLFVRQGRNITLTPAGIELQNTASHILVEQDQLQSRLKMIDRGKTTRMYPLRLFFDLHMTRDPMMTNDLVSAVSELQEEVQAEYTANVSFLTKDLDDPRVELNDVLNDPQVDFWLLGSESPIRRSDMCMETIYYDRYMFLISERHPLYREDLALEDIPYLLKNTVLFMIQNRSRHLSSVIDRLPGGQDISPNIRFEESADVNRLYVALGKGVSIVPENNNMENGSTIGVKCIPVPGTSFYTVAAYRSGDDNPLLPILMEKLKKRTKNK